MLSVVQIAALLAALVLGIGGSSVPKQNSDVDFTGPGTVPTCTGNCAVK